MVTDSQPGLLGLDPVAGKKFMVRKRDGRVDEFTGARITQAIGKAFAAELGHAGPAALPASVMQRVTELGDGVVSAVLSKALQGESLDVERIQDEVEKALMQGGHFEVARRYIVYREEHKRQRALRGEPEGAPRVVAPLISIRKRDGRTQPLDAERIFRELALATRGLEDRCDSGAIANEVVRMLYDGVNTDEINKALVLAAKSRIEKEPAYTYVAARLLLKTIYREVLGKNFAPEEFEAAHAKGFRPYLELGVKSDRLSPHLLTYDTARLAAALQPARDRQFQYMGVQTVYDRYLIHVRGRRIETPQYFWMRVAMGLAGNEGEHKEERAIEFYHLLSSFRFTSSTPTLFNAGTLHQQLSSCYLSTVMDDLEHIFKVIGDDARLSKWAGGLGNDWTNVRATGAYIKGTNGTSQGVIPFLKVANDTAVAVNQGGKRKGAMCAYLETWHLDIEDFLELRKNTGDERRRTHDMNTANWIPDLFMKRVAENGYWTLFSPSDCKDLHDLYGKAFEARYAEYEAMAARNEIKQHKRVEAQALWRKMLSMLFETGHPWMTFKDPSNVRSPQDHTGVVHCSNLCTEILLNTSVDETAVCNLGSINLLAHVADGKLQTGLLARTVATAVRMLDNVIDINYYPTEDARRANQRHRPIGLGIMGFQDALYALNLSYASQGAVEFADQSMEFISYHAILASSKLAEERGTYPTYRGSKWDRGMLPLDTIALLAQERGALHLDMDTASTLDWSVVRAAVKAHGMRNSNTMAIAPTATISNIVGVSQSIEPTYSNLFSKSNLSGEFAVINTALVEDLKAAGLWDDEMLEDLKYHDGALPLIPRVPLAIRDKYKTAFEVEPKWLIECASRRQKWIDMGQSLNLYIREPNGRKLSEMYQFAWRKGLKTTYYLRGQSATTIEKSTVDMMKHGAQPKWMKNKSSSADVHADRAAAPAAEPVKAVPPVVPVRVPVVPVAPVLAAAPKAVAPPAALQMAAGEHDETPLQAVAPKACSLSDPDCEACQ